jgi:hypothetical protein
VELTAHSYDALIITGLHVSSRSYKPITCYQISAKGKELVKRIGRKEKVMFFWLHYINIDKHKQ